MCIMQGTTVMTVLAHPMTEKYGYICNTIDDKKSSRVHPIRCLQDGKSYISLKCICRQ